MVRKNKKGFTIVELLLVVAIVSLLASLILVSVDEGRIRAKEAAYATFGTQMKKVLDFALSEGAFDSMSPTGWGCLGNYGPTGAGGSGVTCHPTAALSTQISLDTTIARYADNEIPQGVQSPHMPAGMMYRLNSARQIEVIVYTGDGHADICSSAMGFDQIAFVGTDHCQLLLPL
jgi:prepilin-type N-terminal cleavage/methylation domain-containing protein